MSIPDASGARMTPAFVLFALIVLISVPALAQDSGDGGGAGGTSGSSLQTLSGDTITASATTATTTGTTALQSCRARKTLLANYIQCLHKRLAHQDTATDTLATAWAACNMNDVYQTSSAATGTTIYPGGSDCTPGTPGYNANATDCGTTTTTSPVIYPGGSDCTPGTPGYDANATDCGTTTTATEVSRPVSEN